MERNVVVAAAQGLHARPAALFVAEAGKQPVPVTIRKVDGAPVPTSSILGVMALGAHHGDEVVLATEVDGDEAVAALQALVTFLERDDLE
jgi:phosphocarrier protein HPr